MLINQQLEEFYLLQPQQSSLANDQFFVLEQRKQEISFGNQAALKNILTEESQLKEESKSVPVELDEDQPKGPLDTMKNFKIDTVVNPFKITDDNKKELDIVPQEHKREVELHMKVPQGILKYSDNGTNSDLCSVFETERQNHVGFELGQSESKTSFSQSVFDSQRESCINNPSLYFSYQGQ